jgi:hypothetical protein
VRPAVIENPILNSPFREPDRHFRFDQDGITNEIVEGAKFSNGYVGLHYFLRNWRYPNLDPEPAVRQRLLDRLKAKGLVEVYHAPDSSLAIRRRGPGSPDQ